MRVCFWSTTFQADSQALAYHLAAQPGTDVLVAMQRPDLYRAEPLQRVLPFNGHLIDREAKSTRAEIERFAADVVIIDNHVPAFRVAKRAFVLWHGFGWRVDDLSQMRRELRKQFGDVTRANPAFRWQAFGDWDRNYRIERSELAPENVVSLGSAYSDWLIPGNLIQTQFDPKLVQPNYAIDLARPTVLLALTWHHGGSFAHWGDDITLLDRLLRHIEARGANALVRMHDRHRYEPAYAEALQQLVRRHPGALLKWKNEAPDSFFDLQLSAVMISNYSSILNGFYHTGRPALHVDPSAAPVAAESYLRWKSGRLQKVRVTDPSRIWKLDPSEHGGLRARSFDELLAGVDSALADPSICRERARAFCARYITAPDGKTCERIESMLRSWLGP